MRRPFFEKEKYTASLTTKRRMRTHSNQGLPGTEMEKLCVRCFFLLALLLVFSVTPFKIDQNKNQNRSIDKIQNLRKEGR